MKDKILMPRNLTAENIQVRPVDLWVIPGPESKLKQIEPGKDDIPF